MAKTEQIHKQYLFQSSIQRIDHAFLNPNHLPLKKI